MAGLVECGHCGVTLVWRQPRGWGGKPAWVHSGTRKLSCEGRPFRITLGETKGR